MTLSASAQKLLDKELLSPSLLTLLLGEDKREQSIALATYSLITTGCKFVLFYNALLYAHAMGTCVANDCTLSKLQPAAYYRSIKRAWPDSDDRDGPTGATVVKNAVSFLLKAAENMPWPWFAPHARGILTTFRDAYNLYVMPTHRSMDDFDIEQFYQLLGAMPLLQSTQFDFDAKCFVFANGDTTFTVDCEPFVYFLQQDNTISPKAVSPNIMVFVEALKGERNNELLIRLVDVQKSVDCQPIIRRVRRVVPNNENLILLCKKMEIDVQWYDIAESWCKLAFLERLTDISCRVLQQAWSVTTDYRRNTYSITKAFQSLFVGTELEGETQALQHIRANGLQNIFYGLFIRCGIFNTMYAMFYDPYNTAQLGSERVDLYARYMDLLCLESTDKGAKCKQYADECSKQIGIRLQKLARIVSPSSTQYDNRKRSIEAEWHAYCVLKIVGINADNLFTDEELMLSIDDYFKMIKNPSTTLAADVGNMLGMLNDFYGALLDNDEVFNPRKYEQSLHKMRTQHQNMNLSERFDCFIDLVGRSGRPDTREHHIVDKLLGRNRICDVDVISDFKNDILGLLGNDYDFVPPKQMSKRFIFVSYSHEDIDRVMPYVEAWRAQKINVWCDDVEVRLGDRWKNRVIQALYNPDCAAMVLFASKHIVHSTAVATEVQLAADMMRPGKTDFEDVPESDRHPLCPILVINLEERKTLFNYLDPTKEYNAITFSKKYLDAFATDTVFAEADEKEKVEQMLCAAVEAKDPDELVEDTVYNKLEKTVALFYLYLKFGEEEIFNCINDIKEEDVAAELENMRVSIKRYLPDSEYPAKCIYPLIASVKESAIKRDNVTIVCYEIVTGKGEKNSETRYILSDNQWESDDYYCIPNYRSMGRDGSWMVNPLLVSHRLFGTVEPDAEGK